VRTSRTSSAPRARPPSPLHNTPRCGQRASSTGRRPTASGMPLTASRTTRRCPTAPSGSKSTGPDTRSPPGLTPRTPRTRRCASTCAAPRAWGCPTRPPTRRRRSRKTRLPTAAPPRAAPPRRLRPSVPVKREVDRWMRWFTWMAVLGPLGPPDIPQATPLPVAGKTPPLSASPGSSTLRACRACGAPPKAEHAPPLC